MPIPSLPVDQPVLIAGPTASGKSALALEIATRQGGVIVNADALQVYAPWRILTARPSAQDEAAAPHRLYGHVGRWQDYSVGHWQKEVSALLSDGVRPIIVGGTGLYFSALTEGLSDIPAISPAERERANAMALGDMQAALHPETADRLDLSNRARVQRAWEVAEETGTALHVWHAHKPAPLIPLSQATALLIDAPKSFLTPRIEQRFEAMLAAGALEEARDNMNDFNVSRPADKAIGAPELIAHLRGEISLEAARERAVIATRQYAKRQRTWFKARMSDWHHLSADTI